MQHWLWRAMDQNGIMLDILLQSQSDELGAKRMLRKLLEFQGRTPRVTITDKLASYGAAGREIALGVDYFQHKGLKSDRAKNSHQPTLRQERQIKRFKSLWRVHRFLSAHVQVSNLFHLRRDHLPALQCQAARSQAFQTWAKISGDAAQA